MQPPRQKLAARLVLGLGVALGIAWLARLDYGRKISTDVLDLIPADERAPELATARLLAGERQAKVALFALTVPQRTGEAEPDHRRRRTAAAGDFARALASSLAVAEVVPMEGTEARDALGAQVFKRRLDLLLPAWLATRVREHAVAEGNTPWCSWLAEQVATDLEVFLTRLEALAFQELLPADPLLLVPGFVEKAQDLVVPAGRAGEGGPALIWARTTASPLREEGQGPVFAAVDQALAAARVAAPDVNLQWTAISRFAAENQRRIKGEMSGLNLISLLAVLTVVMVGVRRAHRALNLAPVILCSLLGAWVVATMVFARVHVLVFVVGSLLSGVAVDYGLYLYLQPPARPAESYRDRVHRLLKPLLASALTTVLGFSLLLCSDLPLIRQLGVFVSAGLISALAAALLWFAQLDEMFLETRNFIQAQVVGGRARLRRARPWLLGAVAAVALAGSWRLQWHDDTRELEIPAPRLRADAQAVRALFGDAPNRTVYLTRGETPETARSALERFLIWHAQAFPGTAAASLGLALPTAGDLAALPARLAEMADFEAQLRAALERHDFDPGEFEPFFAAWRELRARPVRPTYDALALELAGELRGPLALLMAVRPWVTWFATVASHPPDADPPGDTATVGAAQLETLNRLFGRYRASALRISAVGLGLVGLSVFALYGLRRGARIFVLPAGSCLFAFGVFGLGGQTLNLFHLLGAFLGVCLSHNYAIFSAENAARGERPPPSIRL